MSTALSLRQSARRGFTLLEVMLALGITALIALNMALISRSGSAVARTSSLLSILNNELDLTTERMQVALMAANSEEVESVGAFPIYSNRVDFAVDLGVDNGAVVAGDPERILWSPLRDTQGVVSLVRNPDGELERRVTWSRSVPNTFEGEVLGNAEDDNQNGLLDEGGLAFTRPVADTDLLEIHLTVQRVDKAGQPVPRSRRLRVTCRN